MEETKKEGTSQQQTPDAEKKPLPAPAPAPAAQKAATPAVPAQAQAPPRPPVAKPAVLPPPPPSRPVEKNAGRRGFVKALAVIGTILAIVPFVPWGSFLSSTVNAGEAPTTFLEPVVIDDNPSEYGSLAAGKAVNVNDFTDFPVPDPTLGVVPGNGHWVFTYPSSGDLQLDTENPNTFQKFELIRLPTGTKGAASDFVAFSKVCVHLWCSPNYNPIANQFQCPCHGSTYRTPDGLAIAGPASLQSWPTNAIPQLTLQADSDGNLYVFAFNYDPDTNAPVPNPIEANGEIGYGRDYESYEKYILPRMQQQANLSVEKNVVPP